MNNYLFGGNGIQPIHDTKMLVDLIFPRNHQTASLKLPEMAKAAAVSILAYRAINVKAGTISGLPLRFVDENDTEYKKTHPAVLALNTTNKRLWRWMVKDMNIYGSVFLEPYADVRNVIRFKRINPKTIEVHRDFKGIRYFEQKVNGHSAKKWQPNQLVYMFDYNANDDLVGSSPLSYLFKSINVEQSLLDFVLSYFENGATPLGILSSDQHLRPVDSEQYANEWKKQHAGAKKANKIAVIGAGLKYQQITPAIKDLVIDILGQAVADQIAQGFGVPLSILFANNKVVTDVAKDRELLYTQTAIPECELMLDDLATQAVPFLTYDYVEIMIDKFKVDVLQNQRAVLTQRSTELFIKGLNTLNESREMEQRPSLTGGDALFLGGRLIPIDSLNSPDSANKILNGEALNTNFETNPTEPVNPNPFRQAERLRGETPRQGDIKAFVDINPEFMTDELRKWKTKTLRKGSQVSFETTAIPYALKTFIQSDIREKDKDELKEYFDNKISAIMKLSPQEIEDLKKFEDYWKPVVAYIQEYESILEANLFRSFSYEIGKVIENDSDSLSQYIISKTYELENLLNPIIQKVFIAAWLKSKELESNPNIIEFETKSFSDVIERLISKARNFTSKLVGVFMETTLATVTLKLAEWLQAGGTKANFVNYINRKTEEIPEGFVKDKLLWIFSTARLISIAETDVTTAFNESMLESNANKFREVIWKTVLDDKVCKVCAPMHNVVGTYEEGFMHPTLGTLVKVPLHPKCRCFYEFKGRIV